MALQGTLDTFALPDVLRLLASTKKTGRLLVLGDRGDGSVWVDDGSVVGATASGLRQPGDGQVLFELLRYAEGSFTFDADSVCADAHAPTEVEPLLTDAEQLLAEWEEIAAVVPSLDAWVTLAADLPGSEVQVDQSSWKTIVAVGAGTHVRTVGAVLGLGEVEVSRVLRDLVQLGLAAVSADAPGPALSAVPSMDDYGADVGAVNGHALIDLEADGDFSIDIPGVEPVAAPSVEDRAPAPARATEPLVPIFADEPAEADEVARQLASLSPKAARAVAAAAKAETPEEREAALADVTGEDDEPINRGLLLKFLSSVRS